MENWNIYKTFYNW